MAFKYFDWEARPAVIEGNYAWAILSDGDGWVSVHVEEVIDSGRALLLETFDAMFPSVGRPRGQMRRGTVARLSVLSAALKQTAKSTGQLHFQRLAKAADTALDTYKTR